MMHLFSLEDRSIDHGDNLESRKRKRENDKRASGNDCLSINVHQAASKREKRSTPIQMEKMGDETVICQHRSYM